jgi:hypothetical protein
MKTKLAIVVCLLATGVCRAQPAYKIALKGANPSRSLPLSAAGGGVLYVAFRSWDWLGSSKKLQVVAYDLSTGRELRRATINVPHVHGTRVAEGLYLSEDGQMLAYAEAHKPYLVLLISTRNLSELRRSATLPLTDVADEAPGIIIRDVFGGFDSRGLLSFAFSEKQGLRFLRVDPSNLKVVSNVTAKGLNQEQSEPIVWSPPARRTWIMGWLPDAWKEFTEDGQPADESFDRVTEESYGAIGLGKGKLIAFSGRFEGLITVYIGRKPSNLRLSCGPQGYGVSDSPEYVGGICISGRIGPHGRETVLSSEFLLIRPDPLAVVWRREMHLIDVGEWIGEDHEFYQRATPLIHTAAHEVWVVAPERSPELSVYRVPIPENDRNQPTRGPAASAH